ncbi:O-antigen ligase-related protein [mine drainage metagenome]|uniref:O-antigen ligase-related protein n=1 Tax=mine drainage metagenome TaxID=410659 RepID=T1BV53_9ZZZZ
MALDNASRHETARIALPQLEPVGEGEWPVEMLVRGRGRLSAGYGSEANREFRESVFAPVRVVLNKPGQRPWIEIPPASHLEVIPIQLYPGQYSDYPLETSLGLRLAMWRAAWRMFLEHPLLGVGTGAYRDTADAWVRSGDLIRNAADYDHPHQDLLNTLASQGLLGVVFLLAVYLLPLGAFFRACQSPDRDRAAFGFAGCLLVTGMIIGGLTETLFIHSAVITWYTVLISVLYSGTMRKRQSP